MDWAWVLMHFIVIMRVAFKQYIRKLIELITRNSNRIFYIHKEHLIDGQEYIVMVGVNKEVE